MQPLLHNKTTTASNKLPEVKSPLPQLVASSGNPVFVLISALVCIRSSSPIFAPLLSASIIRVLESFFDENKDNFNFLDLEKLLPDT